MVSDRLGVVAGLTGIAVMLAWPTHEARETQRTAAPARPIVPVVTTCTPSVHVFDSEFDPVSDAELHASEQTRPLEDAPLFVPMSGPFETLEHAVGRSELDVKVMPAPPPFQHATVIDTGAELLLVVEMTNGWYTRVLGGRDETEADAPRLLAGPHGAVITLRLHGDLGKHSANEDQLFCGVGPSTIPTCAQLRLGVFRTTPGRATRLRLTLSPCDGASTLAGTTEGQPIREQFRIAFP